jgi:hypothetical protein
VGCNVETSPYAGVVRDIGIATLREPAVMRDSRGTIRLEFRGTSDARSSVDRDTRLRIAVPATQAARLWRMLGERLTDDEKAGVSDASA